MGSRKDLWERSGKLLGSALKMVSEGSRPIETWVDYLQDFVFGSWYERGGVIYFTLTSDGATGFQWKIRLKDRGEISLHAQRLLDSPDFIPTTGVRYNIAVLRSDLFVNDKRIITKVRTKVEKLKLTKPNVEVAYLIRYAFTDKEIEAMGLTQIVVMSELENSNDDPRLLTVVSNKLGYGLIARSVKTVDQSQDNDYGLAFIIP